MKKILIITTGGTIACSDSEGGLSPKNGGKMLTENVTTNGLKIEFLDLFSIDSTDLTPAHLEKLIGAVNSAADFDGIVILHGTDTLEYTAAVLSLTARRDIPVILTGSMIPMENAGSDAQKNLSDALTAACDERLKGAYAVFCGRIIPAHLAVKRSNSIDAFRDFSGTVFGEIADGIVKIYGNYDPPPLMEFPKNYTPVAICRLTPFTRASELDADRCCGLVIESFGAGGLPEHPEILAAVKKAAEKVPVILTTTCIGGTNLSLYAVGKRALECGVREGGKMSTSFAAVRLFIEQGSPRKSPRQ